MIQLPSRCRRFARRKNVTSVKRSGGVFKTFVVSFFATVLTLIILGAFLAYGPISYFRDLWVTTAMGTMNHQWLATMFFDQKTISEIMANNKVIEPDQNTDPSLIGNGENNVKNNATTLPTSPEDGEKIIDGVGFIRLQTSTYKGWVVKLYDPSRLTMGVSKSIGVRGEKVADIAADHGAFVGINASGFYDLNGNGSGGIPDGFCIANGKIISQSEKPSPHSIIGLDKNNRLNLEKFTTPELKNTGLTDAVEFKPFLIVNGVPAKFQGNGGYGSDPRTAIGQTKDGVLIFVIIDGRSISSIGATMVDLQNIMLRYDAYNAANLDGGSSSTLVVNGKVINTPSSKDGPRYVPTAFIISPTK